MRNISSNKITVYLIPLIAMIMFAFFPTSFAGKIGGKLYVVAIWGFLAIFVLYVLFRNTVNISKLKLVLFILIYMTAVTMIQVYTNESARVSIARIAPIVILLLTTTIKVKAVPDISFMEKLIDIFSLICIVWNVGILLQFQPVVSFTEFFYSQYYDRALYYSMLYKKPVMCFGVHTYAAFYYFLLFCCYYGLAMKRNKIKDYFFCLVYMLFTLLLTSNSSLIYAVVMAAMFLWLLRKRILVLLSLFCVGLVIIWKNFDLLWQNYGIFLTDNKSGFRGRYLGSGTFTDNFKVIKNSLGIGFCILDDANIVYSDSGYVMYMTMGGIVLAVLLYFLLILFIRDNMPKPYRLMMIFLIFSFEVALPGTFSYRFVFTLIFATCFFQALDKYIPADSAGCRRTLWKI